MAEQIINTTHSRQGKEKLPELVQFELPELLEFNDVIRTLTLTSSDLEKSISDLVGSLFADFEGSKIFDAGNGNLKCKLYFKPCPNKVEGNIYAVKLRGENFTRKKNPYSLEDMVRTVNMISKDRKLDLEDIAKEILSEFIYTTDVEEVKRYSRELNRPVTVRLVKNWNPYIEEISDPVVPNNRFVNQYLGVTIDLLPVIWKLYGRKDKKDSENNIPENRYQYSVNIVKTINVMAKSYVLEIKRIDKFEVNKLARSIGFGQYTGNIIMTRR